MVFWNRRAEQICGLPSSEALGRHYREIISRFAPRGTDSPEAPEVAVQAPIVLASQPGDSLTQYIFDDHHAAPAPRPGQLTVNYRIALDALAHELGSDDSTAFHEVNQRIHNEIEPALIDDILEAITSNDAVPEPADLEKTPKSLDGMRATFQSNVKR